MRRTLLAGALLAAVAPPGAFAAAPEHNHFRDIGTFVDPDFCESGQTINAAFDVVVNEFQTTFDGEEFVSQEVLVDKGPHPDLESDFELFCETLVPALGIAP